MTGLYDSTTVYDSATLLYDGELNNNLTNLPVLGVFMAFEADPLDGNPDWTEITEYVRQVTINRGRGDDYEQFGAGTASVVLDNRSRVFDPWNTSSPYNGYLLPRKQIQIIAQADGSNYSLFRGFVAGFPATWTDNGADSTVTVDCFDLFGLLARTELPPDWSYQVIQGLGPYDWFRFDDAPDVAVFKNQVGGRRGIPNAIAPIVNNKQGSIAPAIPSGSWNIQSAYQSSATANVYAGEYSACVWIVNTQTFEDAGSSFDVFDYQIQMSIYFAYNYSTPEDSNVTVSVSNYFTGLNHYLDLGPRFFVDYAQHFAMVTNGANAPTVYVNGVPVTPINTIVTPLATPFSFVEGIQFFDGQFQEAVWFRKGLTADEVAQIYGFSAFGYLETSAARADRLLDLTGIASDLIDVTDAPVATVASAKSGSYLLPELQAIADSEGGEVFVSKDGVLTFTNRWYSFGSPTSAVVQATFGESDIHYSGQFSIQYDADQVRNEVAVTYSGDASVTVSDAASITAYGINAYTIDTRLSDFTNADDLATLEATISSVLKPSISPIEVGTTRVASEWATILGLDVLHRIEVNRTPPTGSAIQQMMLVNNLQYNLAPDVWQVTVTGSARLTGWFTADYSLTDGSDVVL